MQMKADALANVQGRRTVVPIAAIALLVVALPGVLVIVVLAIPLLAVVVGLACKQTLGVLHTVCDPQRRLMISSATAGTPGSNPGAPGGTRHRLRMQGWALHGVHEAGKLCTEIFPGNRHSALPQVHTCQIAALQIKCDKAEARTVVLLILAVWLVVVVQVALARGDVAVVRGRIVAGLRNTKQSVLA